MAGSQLSPEWLQPASYIELHGVESSRPMFGFNLFGKLMYLLEEVYSHVACAYDWSFSNPSKNQFSASKAIKSLYEAEQAVSNADSLEEFAILLATSPFPYSRDLALVSLFCSMNSYKLGVQKPDVRKWMYKLSLQDPDALAVAAQDPDFPKIVKLLEGKLLRSKYT